jgi:pilus assembly protein FimV
MLENPIVPATLGGVLALLLGFGIYRAQQRKKSTQVDSSFLESRLQPDSFFGASGGQRIDTNEGGATGSSMVYSPSQLDAAGDVDPVAEADVYLAYGRDLQAEEILKEAMRTQPQRVAIHSKLLEIYSKRRDAKAFELVATEAYGLTHGEGPDWEHICELGQELDPGNTLYRPGGQPAGGAMAGAAMATQAFGAATQAMAPPAQPAAAEAPPAPDIDLDLDFSLDDPASPPAPLSPTANEPTQVMAAGPAQAPPSLDMDFGIETVSLNAPPVNTPAPAAQTETVRLDAPDLMLDPNSLSFTTEPPKPAPPPPAAAAPKAVDTGMIEFDLGALSLDLGPTVAPAVSIEPDTDDAPLSTAGAPLAPDAADGGDPLATKLALAEEFNAIGDPDGARSLAQEVLAEASGDLKSRAQRFLAEIS